MVDIQNTIPYGYCKCGCGQKTRIATKTDRNAGQFKGQPLVFIHTHSLHINHNPQSFPTIEDAFWSHVIKLGDNQCWSWKGYTMKGYGMFTYKNEQYLAHRISYVIHKGPIPKGMEICHSCDNPICTNPSHLWCGTQLDNIADCVSKKRNKNQYTR